MPPSWSSSSFWYTHVTVTEKIHKSVPLHCPKITTHVLYRNLNVDSHNCPIMSLCLYYLFCYVDDNLFGQCIAKGQHWSLKRTAGFIHCTNLIIPWGVIMIYHIILSSASFLPFLLLLVLAASFPQSQILLHNYWYRTWFCLNDMLLWCMFYSSILSFYMYYFILNVCLNIKWYLVLFILSCKVEYISSWPLLYTYTKGISFILLYLQWQMTY